jgi:hypothetical protein
MKDKYKSYKNTGDILALNSSIKLIGEELDSVVV